MAVKFYSGFEWQSVTAGVEWQAQLSSAPTISTTTKNTGGAALRILNATIYTSKGLSHTLNATDLDVLYAQFYFRIATAPDANTSIFTFYDAAVGTMSVSLQVGNDRKLELWYNDTATQVGSDSSALSTDTWYRIEVKMDRSGGAGAGILEAKIDGVTFASTTTATITVGGNKIGIGAELNGDGASTLEFFFDDVVIRDDAYPGGEKVVIAIPTGSGDNNPTTGDYSMIGEIPPSNTATSGSTMIELDSNGVIADFAMTDSLTMGIDTVDTISAVSVLARIREEAAGTSSYQLRLKSASGGTVSSTAAADAGNATVRTNPNGTTAFGRPLISETDPTTGSAWTPTGTNSIDNMQVGITNVDSDSTPDLWCLTLCAMVLYKDGSAPGGTIVKTLAALGVG